MHVGTVGTYKQRFLRSTYRRSSSSNSSRPSDPSSSDSGKGTGEYTRGGPHVTDFIGLIIEARPTSSERSMQCGDYLGMPLPVFPGGCVKKGNVLQNRKRDYSFARYDYEYQTRKVRHVNRDGLILSNRPRQKDRLDFFSSAEYVFCTQCLVRVHSIKQLMFPFDFYTRACKGIPFTSDINLLVF
jgi:hypothetical protein